MSVFGGVTATIICEKEDQEKKHEGNHEEENHKKEIYIYISQASNSEARMMWQEVTGTVDSDCVPRLPKIDGNDHRSVSWQQSKEVLTHLQKQLPIDITSRTEPKQHALLPGNIHYKYEI